MMLMRRWCAISRLRMQVLWRHGFFSAAIVSVFVWMLIIGGLDTSTQRWLAPIVLFCDIAMVGFYVIGGLSMMERSDGTMWALHVTPLRFWESLCATVMLLALLACALGGMFLLILPSLPGSIAQTLGATWCMAIVSLVYGYAVALPYRDFSTFLIPSQFYAVVLFAPLTQLLVPTTEHTSWWWWILPTYPAWHLLHSTQPQWLSVIIGTVAWCLIGSRWAWLRYAHQIGKGAS